MKKKYDLALFEKLVNRFMFSTELVFQDDWEHSKICLENIKSFVSEKGDFLNPKVDNEKSDWGNRKLFLDTYRELHYFMKNYEISSFDIEELFEGEKSTKFINLAKKYLNQEIDTAEISALFQQLFNNGYVLTQEDEAFIAESYKIYCSGESFERWSLLRFIEKLKDKEKIALCLQKRKILFVILSLKKGTPIAYHFPNLLGVLNNAFTHHKNSIELILKAIKVYDREKEILELDSRKGVFQRFLQDYQNEKTPQNEQLGEIIKIVFPELNECY